ncbi:hypothetical protein [Deinococcus rubellus]|uniref:hypothetical protein n=1 Tax=Deinococcus rubellus TaxID=1889240 RepID=UPI0031EDA511
MPPTSFEYITLERFWAGELSDLVEFKYLKCRAADLASAVAEFGIHPDLAETANTYGRAAVQVGRIMTRTSAPMHVLRTTPASPQRPPAGGEHRGRRPELRLR